MLILSTVLALSVSCAAAAERKVTAAFRFGGQMTHVVLLLRGAAFLGRYGILIFSCSLFVLFDLFFQNQGILMEKENLIFLIDPYHYATLWLVCGFVANNSLHLKIA